MAALRAAGACAARHCRPARLLAPSSRQHSITRCSASAGRAAKHTGAASGHRRPAAPATASPAAERRQTAAAPPTPADGSQPKPLPRVVLKGGKSKLFTGDSPSPMVYGGAIDRVVGRPAPKAGDLVLVCDGAEKTIGWGVFNPASMFRVRMMQLADECFGGAAALAAGQQRPDLHALVADRISQAVALRSALGLRCSPDAQPAAGAEQQQQGQQQGQQSSSPAATTVFRLVNSEGDRLSGLIVDVLGPHLVVSSSAAWVERHREAICERLQQATGLTSIVWRPSVEMLREEGCGPEEDGQEAAAGEGADEEAEADGVAEAASSSERPQQAPADAPHGQQGKAEEAGRTVVVVENGVKYAAAPLGQKTGFYADQRDSRAVLRQLTAGGTVLDLCCYSGGFALNAAVGGAKEVVGVDSSAAAVHLAERNAELNGVAGVCRFEKADVGEFMKRSLGEQQRWDVVVFDPPKLAPSRKTLDKATRKYRRLNALAMQLVRPGGLLMTCSCSGAMSQSGDFVPTLQAAARDAGRRVTVLRAAGAAPDHPLDPCFPEGQYLTNVLLRVL